MSSSSRRRSRGIALITTLLAVALLLTILAVLVNITTVQLRRSTDDMRAVQSLAAADAGAAWLRGLLNEKRGDLFATLTALAAAHGTLTLTIDQNTYAKVAVSLRTPAAATQPNHLDRQLQQNALIAESPVQVFSTASLFAGGRLQATRTVTTLIRIFHQAAPYSEVVGVIDNGGPDEIASPGDAGGQIGATFATELRMHALRDASKPPSDTFKDEQWNDGNTPPNGFLP